MRCETLGICVVLLILSASPAFGDFTGNSLHGTLNLGGNATRNYFDGLDPLIGWVVPSASSGIQPDAIVADPDETFFEFMYDDDFTSFNIDVDATSLQVHHFASNEPREGPFMWDVIITGFYPGFGNVTLDSTDFGEPLNYSWTYGGDTLRLTYSGSYQLDSDGLKAHFSLTPVPVPGAILLGVVGLSYAGWRFRRRRAL